MFEYIFVIIVLVGIWSLINYLGIKEYIVWIIALIFVSFFIWGLIMTVIATLAWLHPTEDEWLITFIGIISIWGTTIYFINEGIKERKKNQIKEKGDTNEIAKLVKSKVEK